MKRFLEYLVVGMLLTACSAGGVSRGTPKTYAQGLDSESNACMRNPALCAEATGGASATLASRQRLAERGASIAAGARILDAALQKRIEQALLDCAVEADFQVNKRLFGGNPSRKQCSEVVKFDRNGDPITQARISGHEKHKEALACIREKLLHLKVSGFSLNQRYRFNSQTERWEPMSHLEVEELLRSGAQELVGTIVPDIVIHTGTPLEVLDVYDLKFPCPGSNEPDWREYPEGHPYQNLTQGQVYAKAFQSNPALIAPRWGVLRIFKK